MCRFTSRKMAENRGLIAQPTPPVGVTTVERAVGALFSEISDPAAPSSSGQDAALSRLKHGFDSRRGHQRLFSVLPAIDSPPPGRAIRRNSIRNS